MISGAAELYGQIACAQVSCGGEVEDDEDFSLSPNAISEISSSHIHTFSVEHKNHKFALRHEANREMTPQFVRYNFILHRRRIFYETKVVLINISEKSEKCFHVRPITLCAKKRETSRRNRIIEITQTRWMEQEGKKTSSIPVLNARVCRTVISTMFFF